MNILWGIQRRIFQALWCLLFKNPGTRYNTDLNLRAFLAPSCEDEVALSKLTEGWYIQRPRSSQGRLKLETTIVIQDPFELTRNVSGNLSVRKLDRIVTMFRAAALVLGVVVRNNIGANMDTVFRLLFTPGFEMTEEFSKLIEE